MTGEGSLTLVCILHNNRALCAFTKLEKVFVRVHFTLCTGRATYKANVIEMWNKKVRTFQQSFLSKKVIPKVCLKLCVLIF
jgi:hypothetical protein